MITSTGWFFSTNSLWESITTKNKFIVHINASHSSHTKTKLVTPSTKIV